MVASATAASTAPVAPDECSLGSAVARTRNEAPRLGGTAAGPPAPVALHLVGCRHTESERARGLCALVIEEGDRIKWTMEEGDRIKWTMMGAEHELDQVMFPCRERTPLSVSLMKLSFSPSLPPLLSLAPAFSHFFCVYASVQGSHTQ